MMQPVGVVPQAIRRRYGVRDAADGDAHVAAQIVRLLQQRPPVERRAADPCVNEQNRVQLLVSVADALDDPLSGLDVYALDCVCRVGLVLI